MSALLELIRTSTPAERAEALTELTRRALAGADGPVAILDEHRNAVGYLSAEVDATGVPPLPPFSEEELIELRRRAAHPEEAIPVEEFIRRMDAELSPRK